MKFVSPNPARIKLTIFITGLLFSIVIPLKPTYAQTSVTVTAGVGDTTLTITGKTTPISQVFIIENDAVIGTTASDENGDFYKHLTAQDPYIIEFLIYSTDTDGTVSKPRFISLNLAPYGETHLANVILPPTINITETHMMKGESTHLYGYTVPLSDVTLLFFDSTLTLTATSDETGYWEIFPDTTDLNKGIYIVYAAVTVGSGHLSSDGESKSFTVMVEEIPEEPEDPGDTTEKTKSSKTSGTTTEVVTGTAQTFYQQFICSLPDFLAVFDKDSNCRIDTSEFIESVKAWFRMRQMRDPNCDINKDGSCNLRDFSVLLYHIGR